MKKHEFILEIVSEGAVDPNTIVERILEGVGIVGSFRNARLRGTTEITEQGLKVWANRVCGTSLAIHKKKEPR